MQQLTGAELDSIIFVRDYLQATFALPAFSPRLTLLVWPSVKSVDGAWRDFGDAGYRDELCRLIDRHVVTAEERPGSGLVLTFDSGQVLAVRPAQADLAGPEIALLNLNDSDNTWMVWRPGDFPFSGLA